MNDQIFDPTRPEPAGFDRGLRSLRAVRWLLVAGAAVSAVSVYRLVESQWTGMSAFSQFLTLALGTLALFGTGEVLERRLRLPHAGSALQFLFTGLVPVLSWGAAYLGVLEEPFGWVLFAVTMGCLLAATSRVFRTSLRYQGIVYPWIFGALTLCLPLLAPARMVAPVPDDVFYVLASVVFGGVLHIGSRHINRFLFHRDRRDGVERPVHFLPFLILAFLYVAAMALLDSRSTFVALPLAVVGLVLVRTGEEYYRALVRSTREKPLQWPKRSVALLSVGISLMVIAGPMSLTDSTLRCTTFVFALTTFVLFRWADDYQSIAAHVSGLGTALAAYHLSPSLFPDLAASLTSTFSQWTGISNQSPVMLSIAQLGFQVGLLVFGTILGRRRATKALKRAHDRLTAIHLSALVVLALVDIRASVPFFILALVVATIGLILTRRIEILIAGQWVGSMAVVATVVSSSSASIAFEQALRAAGVFNLILILLSYRLEDAFARFLRIPQFAVRRALLVPASLWGLAVGICGLLTNWVEPVLAGAVLAASGHRLKNRWLLAAGLGSFSLGAHRLVFTLVGAPSVVLTLTTLTFVTLSWVSLRKASGQPIWKEGAMLLFFGHLVVGTAWLLIAIDQSNVTLEPIIVLLAGAALADWGLRERNAAGLTLGLGTVVFYPSLHLMACEWIEAFPVFMLIAAAPLTVLRLLIIKDWPTLDTTALVSQPVGRLTSAWVFLSITICLIFSGASSLALIAIVVSVTLLTRVKPSELPLTSIFLAMLHFMLVAKGANDGYLVLELLDQGWALLPGITMIGSIWLLLVDHYGHEQIWTRSLAVGLESVTVWGYLIANFSSATFSTFENIILATFAMGAVVRHGVRAWQASTAHRAWMMQTWMALAVLHGFTAGWLSFGHGIAPFALLGAAVAEYSFASFICRYRRGPVLAGPAYLTSQLLGLSAGSLALYRVALGNEETAIWFRVLPLFLVSLFYLVVASRQTERTSPSLLSCAFLGVGLAALGWMQGVGTELYCLAPGISLIALSNLLREEMGPSWSRHIFTAGAAFVYATPVLALYDELTWTWQVVLLVTTVAFGSASFVLRSRSLLTISTAAMLIDLTCFVIMIRETEPLLLWVAGLGFGMALIGLAAFLEYQREGLAQQIRVFGKQLQCWH
jgi:hypothetical protein